MEDKKKRSLLNGTACSNILDFNWLNGSGGEYTVLVWGWFWRVLNIVDFPAVSVPSNTIKRLVIL